MHDYKIGDWVAAKVWSHYRSAKDSIKTIVLEVNDSTILVAWDAAPGQSWWVYANNIRRAESESESGIVLGKVCPNTIPKCQRKKYKDVL